MSRYRVLVNGKNFLLEVEGRAQKVGFYATRFVEAADPEEAEGAAFEMIRSDPGLRGIVLNEQDDPPMLYAEEAEEADAREPGGELNSGFSWYVEDKE